jgi:hypothetical protein
MLSNHLPAASKQNANNTRDVRKRAGQQPIAQNRPTHLTNDFQIVQGFGDESHLWLNEHQVAVGGSTQISPSAWRTHFGIPSIFHPKRLF